MLKKLNTLTKVKLNCFPLIIRLNFLNYFLAMLHGSELLRKIFSRLTINTKKNQYIKEISLKWLKFDIKLVLCLKVFKLKLN